MMLNARKLFAIMLFICLLMNQVFSQSVKPILDTTILGKWPHIDFTQISNDGNFFIYSIKNPVEHNRRLILKAIKYNWEKSFVENSSVFGGFFSANNKEYVFIKKDSLCFIRLGTDKIKYLPGVNSYKIPESKPTTWIAYKLNNDIGKLVLKNLFTGKERSFDNVLDYSFDISGKVLLLKMVTNGITELKWINIASEYKPIVIWSSENADVDNYSFDQNGTQLTFTVVDRNRKSTAKSIWNYVDGNQKAVELVSSNLQIKWPNFEIYGTPEFSQNGRWIFFAVRNNETCKKPNKQNILSSVDVWHYKDAHLQVEQLRNAEKQVNNQFMAVVPAKGGAITRLDMPNEFIFTGPSQVTGDYIVISDQQFVRNISYWWIHDLKPSFYLLSLKDGSRKILKFQSNSLSSFTFSPNGKWLVYWDIEKAAYYAFNTQNGNVNSLTSNLPVKFAKEYIIDVRSFPVEELSGTGFWAPDDRFILLYDNYDIWQIDPSGLTPAINITKGYGLKNKIKFRLINRPGTVLTKKTLLLTAFDDVNKYNGFYQCNLGSQKDPDSLFMGPYTFFKTESQLPVISFFSLGNTPEKAAGSPVWIVQRQSAKEAPNFFITSNFRQFKQLTDLHPQQSYNWLTSELINYTQLDSVPCQAVLYKPENFDPNEKYPVIFNYYESFSQRLYEFPYPDYTNNNINIPWFVSHGYIVVTPDFHFSPANISGKVIGEQVYNSMGALVRYLGQLNYIDKNRLGIQGHSFGGLITSYLATHTSLFAAAAEASGSTDPLSAYLTLIGPNGEDNISKQDNIEKRHELYGVTPWERPELYQMNSSVLSADRCAVPLLIMHNKKDGSVQWHQGIELYMALRRLSKPCWLLQYDNGGHSVWNTDAVDYTIRLTQFFDHYLKFKPAPVWMTKGVLATMKGIETGYDLDPSGNCGLKDKPCKICSKWNEQHIPTPGMVNTVD
jgi:dienelactone hydrolase